MEVFLEVTCLRERVRVMMKKGIICILLLVFLSFVVKPHTALGGGGGEVLSYETVGIITVVTILVLFGIPYLMKKHKEKSQEKEKEEALEKREEARQRQKAFIHSGGMALFRW